MKIKNDLMDFNEIWYQEYSDIGDDYALYLISKYLRAVVVAQNVYMTKTVQYFISIYLHVLHLL